MIDLHVHTARCGHAVGAVEDYVRAARAASVDTLCFTDHLPLPEGFPAGYAMPFEQFGDYVSDVRAAAVASEDVEVLCGVEVDWIPAVADRLETMVAVHDLDVVLGSVHFLDDWAFDDPGQVGRYRGLDIDELWRRYFGVLQEAAASGLFDVMAHPDLVKKFGFMPEADPAPLYAAAAEVFAAAGCAVEVNCAGLRKPVAEIYPSLGFLRACRARGVPATMGSDAHAPGEVGEGLGAARELILEAGYDSVVVFRGRRPEEVAL